jgi:serine protease Do
VKDSPAVKSALQLTLARAARATVRMLGDGQPVALGTVFAADGFVVTKASLLQGKLACRLADGRTLDATLVGQDEATDLALLHIAARDLTPAEWRTELVPPGSIVVAPRPEGELLALGVISDHRHPAPAPKRRDERQGWLGIALGEDDKTLEVQNVMPKSAAEKAGLKAGDVIKRLDGVDVKSAERLIAAIGKLPPESHIVLVIERQGQELRLSATLARPPTRLPHDNWGGGPFSERRWGFGSVLPHDLAIGPRDCGGPLVDLDGKVVGINIARALRVASYALPAQVVQETVARLRQPPSQPGRTVASERPQQPAR